MPETSKPNRRVVAARRTLALGTIAATAFGATAVSAGAIPEGPASVQWVKLAQAKNLLVASAEGGGESEGEAASSRHGEGEGEAAGPGEGEGEAEGGAVNRDPEVRLARDLGFMEGHLRAGMALYEATDLEAAKTHMGHPIQEKYDAVADPLKERGYERLKDELEALSAAAEAETPLEELRPLYDTVLGTIEEARDEVPAQAQIMALALLTRVAADEYTVAVEGGTVSNLHEYQDSWGFLRVVETEANELSRSDNEDAARAAQAAKDYLTITDAAFGDLQGSGEFEMDPSLLYGAAARMELAALGLK